MYQIDVRPRANKQIAALPPLVRRRVLLAIEHLTDEPRPPGVKKMEGTGEYHIRVGDYRVVYEIEDDVLLVTVVRTGHRSTIYR